MRFDKSALERVHDTQGVFRILVPEASRRERRWHMMY